MLKYANITRKQGDKETRRQERMGTKKQQCFLVPMFSCSHDQKGFTLIELIVSIAILVIAVFGVNELLTQGITAARRAEKLTVAVNIAQAQIETILSLQYGTLPIGTYEARHLVFEKYARQTTINYIDPNTLQTTATNTGLKKINTTVYYPLPNGEKSYTLSTIITEQ